MPNKRTRRHVQAHHNGHYRGPIPPAPVQAAPMPRIEVWLPLAEEYPDWLFLYWQNHPRVVLQDLTRAKGQEATARVFRELVRQHNGWSDENGQLYPQPTEMVIKLEDDPETGEKREVETYPFWDLIPNQVALALYERVHSEAWSLPNSLMPRPSSSGSSSASAPSVEASAPTSESPGSGSDES